MEVTYNQLTWTNYKDEISTFLYIPSFRTCRPGIDVVGYEYAETIIQRTSLAFGSDSSGCGFVGASRINIG